MTAKMIGAVSIALGMLGVFAAGTPARADVLYPWCAVYGGGEQGIGATICSFNTIGQCVATVRGVGGFCQPNPEYPTTRGEDQPKRRR